MTRSRIIGNVVAARRVMDGKRMATHSYLVAAISEDTGGYQIHDQLTTLQINRSRLHQWIHKPVRLPIHLSHGHVLQGHLVRVEPQAAMAAPAVTGPCHRSKVDEDVKKEVLNRHLLLNQMNVDYQTYLTGHVLTSRAAFRAYEATTLQWSSRNFASYTFDGSMPRSQRCV